MRTITKRTTSLLLNLQYNYTPVSNFEIQNKVNPVVAITLGYQKHSLDLHFRVTFLVSSSLKMLFPKPLRTSKDFYSEPLNLTEGPFPSSTTRSTTLSPDHMPNLATSPTATAPSSAPNSETSPSNCPTIDPDSSAASARRTPAIADSSSPTHPAPSLTLKMLSLEKLQPKLSRIFALWRKWAAKLRISKYWKLN